MGKEAGRIVEGRGNECSWYRDGRGKRGRRRVGVNAAGRIRAIKREIYGK